MTPNQILALGFATQLGLSENPLTKSASSKGTTFGPQDVNVATQHYIHKWLPHRSATLEKYAAAFRPER